MYQLSSLKPTISSSCLFMGLVCFVPFTQVPSRVPALNNAGLLAAHNPYCSNHFEFVALWLAAVCAVCVGR